MLQHRHPAEEVLGWSIYNWILGTAMQNAWLIHRRHHPRETQLEFIQSIVQYYLAESVKPPT